MKIIFTLLFSDSFIFTLRAILTSSKGTWAHHYTHLWFDSLSFKFNLFCLGINVIWHVLKHLKHLILSISIRLAIRFTFAWCTSIFIIFGDFRISLEISFLL